MAINELDTNDIKRGVISRAKSHIIYTDPIAKHPEAQQYYKVDLPIHRVR